MIALEEVAKKNSRKSESELAKEARDKAIREMAEEKLVDQTDLVKTLTTLGARAAAFTIRDRQLEEKHAREEAEREVERRLDMEMEVDRIKDLQRREEEENRKRNKRFEDRKVIIEQIEDRQRAKLIQAEVCLFVWWFPCGVHWTCPIYVNPYIAFNAQTDNLTHIILYYHFYIMPSLLL